MLEPFMLFMSGCVFGQIQLCAHVLPRQCLVQLILAMGTVQARNLSSETFQLGAAFFQGELVLSIGVYFDTNWTPLQTLNLLYKSKTLATRANCYRKVRELVLILIQKHQHISIISASAASAHQQHQHFSSISYMHWKGYLPIYINQFRSASCTGYRLLMSCVKADLRIRIIL